MAEDSATPKYLRVSIDVQLSSRKQTTGRINAAADAAVAAAVETLKKDLLEGSVTKIVSDVEFSYRWITRSSTTMAGAETEPEAEL